MDTAIVKFNALPYAVGSAPQYHDLRLIAADCIFIRGIIRGIIISTVRCAAHMDPFPGFLHSQCNTAVSDYLLRYLQQQAQIFVRKAVPLGLCQLFVGRKHPSAFHKLQFLLCQFLHLPDKPFLHMGYLVNFIHGGPLFQCLVHDKMPLAGRGNQHPQQLFPGFLLQIRNLPQAVPAGFQGTDCLLKCFLVILSNAHDLAYGPHLGTQPVFHALKLFKCPTGKLNHHIVPARHIFVQSAVFSAGNILQRQPGSKHGAHQRNGKSRSFGRKRRRTGCPGVNLYDDNPVTHRVMGKLYIGSADNLHGFHNAVSLLLEAFLQFFGNCQHGRGTEGIPRMHSQGVYILDEADSNHIALRIAYHFQFQLFPSQNRLLHEDLSHQGSLQPPCTDSAQFIPIVYQAASCAAHGISRPQNHRISQFIRYLQPLLHSVGHLAPGHLYPQCIHGFFKFYPVFTALNGIHLNADYLNIIFLQNTRAGKLGAKIQPRLPSQVWQQRIRTFLRNNLLQPLPVQWLNISNICHLRVGHNRSGIGIHQYNLIPQLPQCLTGLGTGIVKFAGLAYYNRTGSYNQYFMNIGSL